MILRKSNINQFYQVDPQYAGKILGVLSYDGKGKAPDIYELEYEFDGWLGDDLMSAGNFVIATRKLWDALRSIDSGVTGVSCHPAICVPSDGANLTRAQEKRLPDLWWLRIHGKPEIDDFAYEEDLGLIVSSRVFAVLSRFKLDNADVSPW